MARDLVDSKAYNGYNVGDVVEGICVQNSNYTKVKLNDGSTVKIGFDTSRYEVKVSKMQKGCKKRKKKDRKVLKKNRVNSFPLDKKKVSVLITDTHAKLYGEILSW